MHACMNVRGVMYANHGVINLYIGVAEYRIMQIVRGGKISRLHDVLVIRGKTFAIVQQFEIPCDKKEKIRWKTFAVEG